MDSEDEKILLLDMTVKQIIQGEASLGQMLIIADIISKDQRCQEYLAKTDIKE